MKTKIVHLATSTESTNCAKELQGLLDWESELHAGPTEFDTFPEHTLHKREEFVLKNNPASIPRITACFYAHYRIWESLTETTIIFEDDARQIKPIDLSLIESFDGFILNLGIPYAPNYKLDKVNPKNNAYDIQLMADNAGKKGIRKRKRGSYLNGAHAYVLTPKGAERLIEATRQGSFIRPPDLQINTDIMEMHDYFPYPFHQERDIRKSTIQDGL